MPTGSTARRTSTARATGSTRTRSSSTRTAGARPPRCGIGSRRAARSDNVEHSLRSVVIDMTDYDWEGDQPLRRSMQDTVIYEMHVAGFTKSPTSGATHPGPSRRHRQDPVPAGARHHGRRAAAGVRLRRGRVQRHQPATGEPLPTTGATARSASSRPHEGYCVAPGRGRHVREFRDMVKASTRPASRSSSTSSSTTPARATTRARRSASAGLDNRIYYHLEPYDKQYYTNLSGCGNTFNCNHPLVDKFIVECLRYWVREMHVDGFRFDLASILSRGPDGNADGRPAGPVAHRARQRAGRHQDHRRGLGRRRAVPGRRLPGLPLGRVERPLPRRHPALRQGRQGARRRGRRADRGQRRHLPGRRRAADQQHQLHHRPRRLHAQRPRLLRRQAQRGQRRGQPRRHRRQPELELRRRGRRPTTRRSRRCALARSATS